MCLEQGRPKMLEFWLVTTWYTETSKILRVLKDKSKMNLTEIGCENWRGRDWTESWSNTTSNPESSGYHFREEPSDSGRMLLLAAHFLSQRKEDIWKQCWEYLKANEIWTEKIYKMLIWEERKKLHTLIVVLHICQGKDEVTLLFKHQTTNTSLCSGHFT
jgi:hypothetical protein